MAIVGIDLSAANPDDAGRTAKGIKFAFVKGSEGSTYRDPKFLTHANNLAGRFIPTGMYHVWRFNGRDPEEQADFAVRNMRQAIAGFELPIVLDVEMEHGSSPAARVAHLIKGLRAVRSQVSRRPMLYTYPAYWAGLGTAGLDPEFAEYELWLAAYTDARASSWLYPPKNPAPWTRRRLWQFGGDVNGSKVEGVRGYCDQNLFEGSEGEFASWVNPLPIEEAQYRELPENRRA